MEAKGASRSRMTVKIAGGAKMFEISGGSGLGNIGQRNIESVHTILRNEASGFWLRMWAGKVARPSLRRGQRPGVHPLLRQAGHHLLTRQGNDF